MDIGSRWRRVAGIVLALTAVGIGLSPVAAAEKESKALPIRVTEIDYNECEPYQVRAQIMDLDGEKGTIVVAEKEIRSLDAEVKGKRIKTEYLTIDGKPEPSSSFHVGQYVWVKGVLHPDGFVAAFVVQKIVKPREEKFVSRPNAERPAGVRKNGRWRAAPAAKGNQRDAL